MPSIATSLSQVLSLDYTLPSSKLVMDKLRPADQMRPTDGHLTSLLTISASRFESDYGELLEMQLQFHSSL